MLKTIDLYIKKVKPTEKFLSMAYANNKLKVAYSTHVDIATYKNGDISIERSERNE